MQIDLKKYIEMLMLLKKMWKVHRNVDAINEKTNQIYGNSFISPSLIVKFDKLSDSQFSVHVFSRTFQQLLESEIKERINQAIYRPWQIFPMYNYTKANKTQVFDDDLDEYINQNAQMLADTNGSLSPIQWITKYSHVTMPKDSDIVASLDFYSDTFDCKSLTDLANEDLSVAKIQINAIAKFYNSDGSMSTMVPFGNTFNFNNIWTMPEDNHGISSYEVHPNSSNVTTEITNLANILHTLGSNGIAVPFDLSIVCSEIDQEIYTRMHISLSVCIQLTSVIHSVKTFDLVVGLRNSDNPFTKQTKVEDIDWDLVNSKHDYNLNGSVFYLVAETVEKFRKAREQRMYRLNYSSYMRMIIHTTKAVIDRENTALHDTLDNTIKAMNNTLLDSEKAFSVYSDIFIPSIYPYIKDLLNAREQSFLAKVADFVANKPLD